MLRKTTTLVSLLLTAVLLVQPVTAAFTDVAEDAWYAQSVDYVERHSLFNGVGDNAFAPEETMTRAMFVTVLCRMADVDTGGCPDSGFSDVAAGSWYADAVSWGRESGVVMGVSDTEFQPDSPVTREQITTLILRFCDYLDYTLPQNTAQSAFPDEDQISDYAKESVAACQAAGLINGYTDGSFRPFADATRAEVAAVITRLGTLLEDAGYSVGSEVEAEEPEEEPEEADWRLILVNPWNSIPDGYVESLTLKTIPDSGGYQVDARIYDDLAEMLSAMRNAGLSPVINSAFRTHAYQQKLYNNKVSQYQSYGYSLSEAQALAGKWVAVPGTSEHELGLAVDISMYTSDADEIHAWLQANSYRYGFIYRYPEGKTDITGVNPEPWHYRYVGKENAQDIYASGLTLEEYLAR